MINGQRLSITTGSLNRLEPLKQSLATWLAHPEPDEIILVDWGNEIPLLESLHDFTDPRIIIARAEGQKFWHNSKCHNLELQLATGEQLLRLDNDCLLDRTFFEKHVLENNCFFAGDWQGIPAEMDDKRNLTGTLYVHASDVRAVNGYNERLLHYGYEDDDLYHRLVAEGLKRNNIDLSTVEHIPHSDTQRYENLEIANQLPHPTAPKQIREKIAFNVKRNLTQMSRTITMNFPWTTRDHMTEWRIRKVSSNYYMCEEIPGDKTYKPPMYIDMTSLAYQDSHSNSISQIDSKGFNVANESNDEILINQTITVAKPSTNSGPLTLGANLAPGMPPHRINFVDFHDSFSVKNNSILGALRPYFNLELSNNPDFLFYSVFGDRFGFKHTQTQFNHCIRIWWTEENFRPNFSKCDYALTFDHLKNEPRHLRLPLYVRYLYHHQERTGKGLIKGPNYDAASILRSKNRFCNFIYSNSYAKTRIAFFFKLSKYKQVDSGGAILNNLNYRPANKLEFITPYKFTIAFENATWPGYVTEKLVEPMLVDSIPIYWGNPSIEQDFNLSSFINCHEYQSLDEVVEQVIRLDQDDDAYIDKLKQPWFIDNIENKYCRPDYLIPFFTRVFANKPHSRPKWANVAPIDFSREHRVFG